MTGDFFLWILAGATVAAGIALLIAFPRRTHVAPRAPKLSGGPAADVPSQPNDFAGRDEPDEDSKLAKICPTCGSRYRHEFRTCKHDNSELAAIN